MYEAIQDRYAWKKRSFRPTILASDKSFDIASVLTNP